MAKTKTNTNKDKTEKEKVTPVRMRPEIRPIYANVAAVHHTSNEFIFDFVFQLDGDAELVSRVILSPDHAKRFSDVLVDNYARFEKKYKKAPPKKAT
jgi:hypothetical protein